MNYVGRFLYFLLGRIYPYLPRLRRPRVRVIVLDDTRNILLVRSWLSNQQWSLPGGGVNNGETPQNACIREVKEETGLHIGVSNLKYMTTLYHERLRAELPVYVAWVESTKLLSLMFPYNFEIIERKWFSIDELPTDISAYTVDAIKVALLRET